MIPFFKIEAILSLTCRQPHVLMPFADVPRVVVTYPVDAVAATMAQCNA